MDTREEKDYISIKLKLYGIVQGVGFRPFVVKLAYGLGITGMVKNSGGMVEIIACGEPSRIETFIKQLFLDKPYHALIVHHVITEISPVVFSSFTIEQSIDAEGPVFISPDLCVCDACLKEMQTEADKRHMHPFISCMACGPRYSIIEDAPYDRETTTMQDFEMCAFCETQYKDRQDRRYHAQTISCHHCGPFLIYRDKSGNETTHEAAFASAEKAVKNGGIIAVKGVGGYHLCCSPYDQSTVMRLRELKHREQKPFAVMFADIEDVKRHAEVSPQEEALLQSGARPVVLLNQKPNDLAPAVCNQSRYVGAFLSYTPLYAMLLKACGPLVMTSANVSEEPIIKDDEPMLAWKGLDGVLYNKRRIAARLDDSVAKVTAGKTQIFRRSRGYAPLPVIMKGFETGQVFAAGGHLKSAFCLASGPFAYCSPFIGDLDNEGCIEAYSKSFERMKKLFRIHPELAVCDMHPGYASTGFAQSLGLPLLKAQHHHAHIASVMAEHSMDIPVIGVAFDGTGWGEDGTVWGGEFLICREDGYERAGHLKPVQFLGGDEGMRGRGKKRYVLSI